MNAKKNKIKYIIVNPIIGYNVCNCGRIFENEFIGGKRIANEPRILQYSHRMIQMIL
jgi:hypothetical protein